MPLILDGALALIESTLAGDVLDEASAQEVAAALDALKKSPRDRKAQDTFANAAYPLVQNLARTAARRHPKLDTDEIVQDVMLKATQGAVGKSWRGGDGNKAKRFLATLVNNAMRDTARKNKADKRGGDRTGFSLNAPTTGDDGSGFDPADRRAGPSRRVQNVELKGAIGRVVKSFSKDQREQNVIGLWMKAVKGERPDLVKKSSGKPNTRAIGREAGFDTANPGRDADKVIARFMQQARGKLSSFMGDDMEMVLTALVEAIYGIDPFSSWLTVEAACDLIQGAVLNG